MGTLMDTPSTSSRTQLFLIILSPRSEIYRSSTKTYWTTRLTYRIILNIFRLVLACAFITIGCAFGLNTIISHWFVLVLLASQKLFLRLMGFYLSHRMGTLLLMLLSYATFFTFSNETKRSVSLITGMSLLLGNFLLLIMLWDVVFMAFRLLWMLVHPILTIL